MGIVMRAQDASEDADEYIGAISEHIVPSAQAGVTEAEHRSDRAQDPCALRVAAACPASALAQYEERNAEAMTQFKEAIRLRPDFAAAHANLALVLHRDQDYDGAIAKYTEALRLEPSAPTYVNAGLALESRRRTREAPLHYRRAVELEPDNGPAREGLERLSTELPTGAR